MGIDYATWGARFLTLDVSVCTALYRAIVCEYCTGRGTGFKVGSALDFCVVVSFCCSLF